MRSVGHHHIVVVENKGAATPFRRAQQTVNHREARGASGFRHMGHRVEHDLFGTMDRLQMGLMPWHGLDHEPATREAEEHSGGTRPARGKRMRVRP